VSLYNHSERGRDKLIHSLGPN